MKKFFKKILITLLCLAPLVAFGQTGKAITELDTETSAVSTVVILMAKPGEDTLRIITKGNFLQDYLAIADTSGMLSNYIVRGDTATMLLNYIREAEVSGTYAPLASPDFTGTLNIAPRSSSSTTDEGDLYYDTEDDSLYLRINSDWVALNRNTGTGGSMTWPDAGIAVSSGASSWSASITDNSSNWNTAYDDRLKWDGGATDLVAATGRTSLGGTTIGQNMFVLTNPSAITFPRFNADNTITARSATELKTDLSLENVTNESKATMFANSTFTGTSTINFADLDSIKIGDNVNSFGFGDLVKNASNEWFIIQGSDTLNPGFTASGTESLGDYAVMLADSGVYDGGYVTPTDLDDAIGGVGADSSWTSINFIPISTAPSTNEGDLYYDTEDDSLYLRVNTSWVALNREAGTGGGSYVALADSNTVYDEGYITPTYFEAEVYDTVDISTLAIMIADSNTYDGGYATPTWVDTQIAAGGGGSSDSTWTYIQADTIAELTASNNIIVLDTTEFNNGLKIGDNVNSFTLASLVKNASDEFFIIDGNADTLGVGIASSNTGDLSDYAVMIADSSTIGEGYYATPYDVSLKANLASPDFTGNLNIAPRSSPVTTDEGDLYYDTEDDSLYLRVNSAWVALNREGGSGSFDASTVVGSGLSYADDSINLGGQLTSNAYITNSTEDQILQFRTSLTSPNASAYLDMRNGGIEMRGYPTSDWSGTTFNFLNINVVGEHKAGLYDAGDFKGITYSTTEMVVDDIADETGLVYGGDYSANFVDSSLVDKKYVDDIVNDTVSIETLTPLLTDVLYPIKQWEIGYGLATDTIYFDTNRDIELGHFRIEEDSLVITRIDYYIPDGDTIDFDLVFGSRFDTLDTKIADVEANDGDMYSISSFSEDTVPEGNYIWLNVVGLEDGRRPTMLRVDLYGYIKRD